MQPEKQSAEPARLPLLLRSCLCRTRATNPSLRRTRTAKRDSTSQTKRNSSKERESEKKRADQLQSLPAPSSLPLSLSDRFGCSDEICIENESEFVDGLRHIFLVTLLLRSQIALRRVHIRRTATQWLA